MSENAANDLLMGGGIKSAKFDNLGDTAIGTIVDEPKAVQMTKYQSTELDFWPSGDPKMQIVVTIQTDQRDDAQDDGRRRLHIPPRMMPPVREAIQAKGAKGLAIGGRIAVQWFAGTGQGEGNPKQYRAEYAPPAVDPGSLLASSAPAAAPAVPAAPMLSPTPAAAPADPWASSPAQPAWPNNPAPAAGLLNGAPAASSPADMSTPPAGSNIDPARWAALPDAQKQAVLAAMGNTPGY